MTLTATTQHEMTDSELLAIREEDIEFTDDNRVIFRKCAVCGVQYPSWAKRDDSRCRCRRAAKSAHISLDEIDPARVMTLDTLDDESDRTITKAAEIGRQIVQGDRLRGLAMFGEPGRGKTHVMVGLMRYALDPPDGVARRVACWHNVSRLVARLQASYSDTESPDAITIIDTIADHEIVMLDDLGKERDTEDTRKLIYDLVDALYTRRRTLILSTNLSLGEFELRYDAAVRSRITAMSSKVQIKGRDRRRDRKENG